LLINTVIKRRLLPSGLRYAFDKCVIFKVPPEDKKISLPGT
jgi:hypothetical protein